MSKHEDNSIWDRLEDLGTLRLTHTFFETFWGWSRS